MLALSSVTPSIHFIIVEGDVEPMPAFQAEVANHHRRNPAINPSVNRWWLIANSKCPTPQVGMQRQLERSNLKLFREFCWLETFRLHQVDLVISFVSRVETRITDIYFAD